MGLELPRVGGLMKDEPSPQRLVRDLVGTLKLLDIGLDQVERAGFAITGHRAGQGQDRIELAEHPLGHQA